MGVASLRRLRCIGATAVAVVALALVTPTIGLSRSGPHELLLFHPVFPHHHDADTAHDRAPLHPGSMPTGLTLPVISQDGLIGAAPSLATEGVAFRSALPLAMTTSWSSLRVWPPVFRPQAWVRVPTDPPRR